MAVEEIRGYGENRDIGFPVGLRVLAVDDDMICLKLLETMLRKCQYHVTTSSQPRMALKMLRENKNGFDLVITDVHMPDIDGFKLLELVGLEMDIPVIMLLANNDPNFVLKGVNHGACDYLVKPVRLEELKNIWQHVIRKNKVQVKDIQNVEVCESPVSDTSDQKPKLNRKRKDEEDIGNDDDDDDDDPITQKKPRVIWKDLHHKFVAVVNQLGLEKAVPKKILELMNVEGLTRENVASHLQKFRIGLKKQANMRAAAGLGDNLYMRSCSSDLVGDYRTFSGRLPNTPVSPYIRDGMLNRPNAYASFDFRNVTQPPLIQPNLSHNLNNYVNRMQPSLATPTDLCYSQGKPSSMVFNNFQKSVENFDMTANHINTFISEPYNVDVNGVTSLPDNFQLPVDSVRETNASNCFVLPSVNRDEISVSESRLNPVELPKWQGGFDSLEDLVNTVLKQDQDGAPNCNFGIDDYAFGAV